MRRKLMLFAAGILVAAVVAACGGGPTLPLDNGLLTEQNAIERAVEQLKRPAPEITGVENPRNPVAWRMTLGVYYQRTGGSASSEGADTSVRVVHVEGESSDAGIVPPESRKTFRYAVAVLDARTGNVIATRRSNEPLAWPKATNAASMSDPGRMVRETPEPTPTTSNLSPTATPGLSLTPAMLVSVNGQFERVEGQTLILRQKVSSEEFLMLELEVVPGAFFLCNRRVGKTVCDGSSLSEFQPGLDICAYARLVNGRLEAGKVFGNAICSPQARP